MCCPVALAYKTIMYCAQCIHFFLNSGCNFFLLQYYACSNFPLVVFNAVIQNLLGHCISWVDQVCIRTPFKNVLSQISFILFFILMWTSYTYVMKILLKPISIFFIKNIKLERDIKIKRWINNRNWSIKML